MTPAVEPRPLMEHAYDRVSRGDVVVVVAPTSYGKTAASPWMYRRSYEDGVAGGLIHVAPLRSLLRRAYRGFFKPLGGRLQMHGAPPEEKSPYFLSSLVASTLDSFLWNLYRVPVAEALKIERGVSMGHYYPILASIFTSLVVFDEAHMYLWEDPGGSSAVGAEAVEAAVATLAEAGVPLILETATVRPRATRRLARVARRHREQVGGDVWVGALRAPRGSGACSYLDVLEEAVGAVARVEDPEWEAEKLVPWETRVAAGGWEGVVGEIAEEASRGPVLVVANTVGEAVEVYRRLRADDRVPEAVLVHGRLGEAERAAVEEGMLEAIERSGGVVVATQAAEAGLDVNSMAVYTAPAPLESLVQRAGRACRRGEVLEECRVSGGRVVVVSGASIGPYDEGEAADALRLVGEVVNGAGSRALDWRAPCNGGGRVGYGSLLARLAGRPRGRPGLERLLRAYLAGDVQPWVLVEEILEGMCGLVRGTAMVEVDVGGDVVVVPLDWALRHASEVLETVDGVPVLVVDLGKGSVAEGLAKELWRAWEEAGSRRLAGGCGRLLKALSRDAAMAAGGGPGAALLNARFKARPGAYVKGLGLILPGEAGAG